MLYYGEIKKNTYAIPQWGRIGFVISYDIVQPQLIRGISLPRVNWQKIAKVVDYFSAVPEIREQLLQYLRSRRRREVAATRIQIKIRSELTR